ncbi:Holliday junction branch migration protein RuvA [Curtobacterium sp. Leaf261]|uniref:Holliday junction branch migration protein RuvA n=1 Tax=Curtobacterium sp. Leaf261 TaxID=1736311 RepID=UPI0009EBFFDB|nr:Holliday junction branch migration protein RuvA [Curtobacterium sp. Leaf261]
MIASLRGTCIDVAGSRLVLEVGGVGYAVTVTPQHALSVRHGADVFVRTALIVREDDFSLFGFETTEALEVFDLLRSVSGVGPKSALGVLAAMSPAQVARAVTDDDDAAFRKVSGIGPKTAKLITVQLAGKVTAVVTEHVVAPVTAHPASEDVVTALVGLGWREDAARIAVEATIHNEPGVESMGTQALLRAALGTLNPAAAQHSTSPRSTSPRATSPRVPGGAR